MSTEYPKLVVLHDQGHTGLDALRSETGLESPISIRSFTDTFPDNNTHNKGLFGETTGAEMVLVQKSLLSPPTVDAKIILDAAFDAGSRVGLFDETNRVQMIDLVSAQRIKSEIDKIGEI